MATTTYKGYELMATGTQTNTWGDVLNDDVFSIVDANLGGIVTKSLTNVNVTLSASESEAAILYLTGTLTGNVTITTSCQGFFFVDNQTSGAFTVTVKNSFVSTSCIAPQKRRVTVISDQSNGCRIAGDTGLESGTVMLFVQTSAPTGWTKDTTHNNKALRIVSGTASTGGSIAFTTAFASQAVAGTVGSTTLTEAQIPSHRHFGFAEVTAFGAVDSTEQGAYKRNSSSNADYTIAGTSTAATVARTSLTGGGTGHDHSFTGTAINLAVQYVDVILATRD